MRLHRFVAVQRGSSNRIFSLPIGTHKESGVASRQAGSAAALHNLAEIGIP